ncbi:16S rRNA (guanine(527)-N(7))-methyltransferase RsmG [Hugenholtzia roseola]|uniref:16S rRNA (guanine(527)-N(7))-methyltransferase RsmG n=1 Tax=Hugenholtzia roseola TaxID=1002 RepID=UPI0004179B63|nr:16S rRNA (guanine(527)-N(7))-methyltransferase RsmG [Hugenholtzia roseola]
MELIKKYFPQLSDTQISQFEALLPLYTEWNEKINVISRKDIENLYERHVLHALAIGKVASFEPNDRLLDVGTGGGFPGIPLAILFPEASFHLVDSIGKKIKVVQEVAAALGLKNVVAEQKRGETLPQNYYDFVLGRGVTDIKVFFHWVRKLIRRKAQLEEGEMKNGILYLKGGDLKEELADFKHHIRLIEIADFFEEEFFESKKVLYIPL